MPHGRRPCARCELLSNAALGRCRERLADLVTEDREGQHKRQGGELRP